MLKLPKKEGNAMTKPFIGETFDQCKKWLWDLIHQSQKNIDELIRIKNNAQTKKFDDQIDEIVKLERQYIRDIYQDLKELQRWFKQSGLDSDQPVSMGDKYGKK